MDKIDEAIEHSISITHKHILSIINTKLRFGKFDKTIRILDAGCGNCELVSYLQKFVPIFNDSIGVEVYGFDVSDSKVQFGDYCTKAHQMLAERFDDIDWNARIKIISTKDKWPFDNSYFDIIVSNQVLEHVQNHHSFFSENYRVQKMDGFAIHLFPLKNYIIEGHVRLPFAHRFNNWHSIYTYLKILSYLRLGKWKYLADKCSVDDFSKSYSDFLSFYCNYLSMSDLIEITRENGFRVGFNFSGNFYYEKLKEVFRIRNKFIYNKEKKHLLSIHLLKYISSITLFLEKKDEYINYIALYPRSKK